VHVCQLITNCQLQLWDNVTNKDEKKVLGAAQPPWRHQHVATTLLQFQLPHTCQNMAAHSLPTSLGQDLKASKDTLFAKQLSTVDVSAHLPP